MLCGEMEPDSGSAEYAGGTAVGYLPQDLVEIGDEKVLDFLREKTGLSPVMQRLNELEHLISESPQDSRELARYLAEHEKLEQDFSVRGGYEFDSVTQKVLRGLGFAHRDAERRCSEFSGGWKMRLALAGVLLQKPDVLLLDEPTNHLDTESMEWLEGWLRDHRGVMIFVSHDRRFIGRMATEIAELSYGNITRYSMGYEQYIAEREASRERMERAIEEQKEKIEQIERFIERFRYKATKATQVQSRIKQLEKMEIYDADMLPKSSKSVHIRFPEAARSGRDVLSAHGLSKSYGDIKVFSDLDVEIQRGERVALVGVNGAGKSTLLRLLSGCEAPDSGSVQLGYNVKQAYFSQESAQNLNYAHTVWEETSRTGSLITEAEKRSLLGSFLFSGEDIQQPIRVLSGGEKSRVALFKLLLSDSNFMILDEPTNHLDMNTREIFQRALLEYGGTLLIVSHDRFFLDDLVERVIEIRDGVLYDYRGNYSWFIERRAQMREAAEQSAEAKPAASPRAPQPPADSRERRRQEAEERNRLSRERKVYTDKIAALEAEISSSEARRNEIDALLCLPEVLRDSTQVQQLMIERSTLEETISSDYQEWEKLSEIAESIK